MKKIMSVALLSVFGVAYVGAQSAEDLVFLAKALKGKTVEIPAKLVKQKHQLIAAKFREHAMHVRHEAAGIKDWSDKLEYRRAAREMDELATTLQLLPPVNYTMTFEHPEEMLWLKAQKAQLKGAILKAIGEKLGDRKIAAFGDVAMKWGQDLTKALKESKLAGVTFAFAVGSYEEEQNKAQDQDGQDTDGQDDGQDNDDEELSEDSEEL